MPDRRIEAEPARAASTAPAGRLIGSDGRTLLPSQQADGSAAVLLDGDGLVLEFDDRYPELIGADCATGIGTPWVSTLPDQLRVPVAALLDEVSRRTSADRIVPLVGTPLRWLRVHVREVRDHRSRNLLLVQLEDLSDPADESLVGQVIRDPLTGLYNRQALLELAALPDRVTDRYCGVAAIDVRRFRRLNDVWGRSVGDEALVATSRWLAATVSPGDVVIRLGDAEFLVLLEAASQTAQLLESAEQRTITIGGRRIQLSLQVGLAERSGPGSLLALADRAETALRAAKRQAWRTVVPWTAEIARQASQAARHEEAVQQAIAAHQETVLFQPIVDLRAGRVSGIEALVRLGGPASGIPAEQVLQASHRLGLTPALAERVYRQAFDEGLRLRSVFAGCQVGVNLSREFLSTGLAVDTLLSCAHASGLPLDQIVMELTEDVAAGLSTEVLFSELGRAADQGIQIVIDDFGRGETSLSLLRRLPLAAIKLDRSLLPLSPADERGWDFIDGVIALLGKICRRIVAEGIESESQSQRLQQLGVFIQQGYLFSPPQDLEYWLTHGLDVPTMS